MTPCDAEMCETGCACPGDCLANQRPRPLVAFIDGLLLRLGREPTEAELRAAAHALTVRADRVARKTHKGDSE